MLGLELLSELVSYVTETAQYQILFSDYEPSLIYISIYRHLYIESHMVLYIFIYKYMMVFYK